MMKKFVSQLMMAHYGKFVAVYFALCLLIGYGVLTVWPIKYIWIIGGAIVLFEIIIRGLLCLAFGKNYYYVLFPYTLVDDPFYGNAFRKSCQVKNVLFLIFDKYIFPFGLSKSYDLTKNQADRIDFNINTLGFRGAEFDPRQKRAQLRIFCSGGSTTACDGNADNEVWSEQLEFQLKKSGLEVEVINAGVQGWYSYQELLRIKQEIINYQPDVVLLHQGWNEEFEYSSQRLGKSWKPRVVRNMREANYLYCAPNPMLSSTAWLSFYLGVQAYMKQCVFVPNMRFDNPRRWEVLLKNDYLLAWFDNMAEIAKILSAKGGLVYNVDYPCLVDVADTLIDRQIYIKHFSSRLNENFAEYQAISKLRISHVLDSAASLIPCLRVQKAFNRYRGKDRLSLFGDEVHLTPKGNSVFAEELASLLLRQPTLRQRYDSPHQLMGVSLDEGMIPDIRRKIASQPEYIERMVQKKIATLGKSAKTKAKDEILEDIPEDRYTTF